LEIGGDDHLGERGAELIYLDGGRFVHRDQHR
jgi:hypothetical protein